VAKHGLRMILRCLDYMKPHWFAAEKCHTIISNLVKYKNINLDSDINFSSDDNGSNGKPSSKKRRSAYHSTNLDDMAPVSTINEMSASSQSPSTPPSIPSQINATPASIREYSAAMRQHVINQVPSNINGTQPFSYDPNSSPASESSTTSYMSINDPTMKADNELFMDSHIPEVSSFMFNDSENNPFLSLPISLDWTNLY
ncbi:7605_t:CDS:1, partial [Racocetra fulgida]